MDSKVSVDIVFGKDDCPWCMITITNKIRSALHALESMSSNMSGEKQTKLQILWLH